MKSSKQYVLLLALLIVACSFHAHAEDGPPTREFGLSWTLVSFPCALDSDTLRTRYSNAIQVFSWDGKSYKEATQLEPGKGYFINYDFDIAPTAACPIRGDSVMQFNVNQGWNLIGNPLRNPVPFKQFIPANANASISRIYAFENNSLKEISPNTSAKPGIGYWIYINIATDIEVLETGLWENPTIDYNVYFTNMDWPQGCEQPEAFLNGTSVPLSVTLQLRASATQKGANISTARTDITNLVTWEVSDTNTASVNNGLLQPTAPGRTVVRILSDGNELASRIIDVFDDSKPLCLHLAPATIPQTIDINDTLKLTATALYADVDSCMKQPDKCALIKKDVTRDVQWVVDNPDAGFLASGIFKSGDKNTSTFVHASYQNLASNKITIKVQKFSYTELIAINPQLSSCADNPCGTQGNVLQLQIGETLQLRAEAKRMTGERRDVTQLVQWSSNSSGVASVRNNTLKAHNTGLAIITASLPDGQSAVIYADVGRTTQLACIKFANDVGSQMAISSSRDVSIVGYLHWDISKLPNSCSFVRKELKDVGYVVSNNDAGTMNVRQFKAGNTPNIETAITATHNGMSITQIVKLIQPVPWHKLELSIKNLVKKPRDCTSSYSHVYQMQVGEELEMALNGYERIATVKYGSTSYSYNTTPIPLQFTEDVLISLTNREFAQVSGNKIKALKPGTFTLNAIYADKHSNSFSITVVEKDAPSCIKLYYTQNSIMVTDSRQALNLYAYYPESYSQCNGQIVKFGSCNINMAAEADWTISDPSLMRIEQGTAQALANTGSVDIYASLKSINSNHITFDIKSINDIVNIDFKLLKTSGYSPPECENQQQANGLTVSIGDQVPLSVIVIPKYYSPYSQTGKSDVTLAAVFSISNPEIAVVEKGILKALKPGTLTISANYSNMISDQTYTIHIRELDKPMCFSISPSKSAIIPLQGSIQFSAYEYYANMSVNCARSVADNTNNWCRVDVTDVAQWIISKSQKATIDKGMLVAGDVTESLIIHASHLGNSSNSVSVSARKSEWLIVTLNLNAPKLAHCPILSSTQGCHYTVSGKEHSIRAYGQEESWKLATGTDVTSIVKWEVSDPEIVQIDARGILHTKGQGLVWIRATAGDARSGKTWLAVARDPGFEFLMIGSIDYAYYKPLQPVKTGNKAGFQAVHFQYNGTNTNSQCSSNNANNMLDYYDYSYCNDTTFTATYVTDKAVWSISDTSIGEFSLSDSSYSFNGYRYNSEKTILLATKAMGLAKIEATFNKLRSNELELDVWNETRLSHCNPDDINIGKWQDDYASASMETDCRTYKRGEPVNMRYTAYTNLNVLLDNCLDLYIVNEDGDIVRTLREQNCTTENVGRVAARRDKLIYQYAETWDMLDASGNPVPAGNYYAVARFFVIVEPIIRVPFNIVE